MGKIGWKKDHENVKESEYDGIKGGGFLHSRLGATCSYMNWWQSGILNHFVYNSSQGFIMKGKIEIT